MKKFIVVGNKGSVTYKDLFPYVKNKEITFGYTHNNNNEQDFIFEDKNGILVDLDRICCWLTNIAGTRGKTIRYVNKDISEYRKYDNYDAVEVASVRDIPDNYYGVMGLSVAIFSWNLDDYDIIGKLSPKIDGKPLFNRILIRRKR